MMPVDLQWLSQPRNVVILICLYLASHFALRLSFGPVLGLDDAEQALFAQQWVWSYRFEQPPLFTWLLLPTFDITGVNYLALNFWRYFWLGVIFLGSYRILLHWFCWQSNDPENRLYAALATLSLLSVYVLAYFSHHDLTHTTIMTAFIVLGWWQFTRLVIHPSWTNYILLGAVFAGGLLGKWNYIVFCAALALSCLFLSRYRALLWTPKVLAAIATTSLLVMPTLLFVAGMERPYGVIAEAALAGKNDAGFWAILVKGSGALLASLLVYLLPFLLFAGVLFFQPLKTAWSMLRSNSKGVFDVSGHSPEVAPVTLRFLLIFTAVGITLLWY